VNVLDEYKVLTRLRMEAIIVNDLSRLEGGDKLANEVGKRYFCEKCGTEFIVTKAGDGKLTCCGQPMTLKK